MKIAVTGACGHIGLNVIDQLVKAGHEVRALYHQEKNTSRLPEAVTDRMAIDVTQPQTLSEAFIGCDAAIHLAAVISIDKRDAARVYAVNSGGTRNVIDAARAQGISRFVHVSSVHALNRFPKNQCFNDACALANDDRHSAYDQSKAQAEQYVQAAVQDGFDAVIIRPVGVIGPLDHGDSLIAKALLSIYRRELPAMIAGGFNWVHSGDVARMIISALDNGRKGDAYLVAGEWVSFTDIAKIIEKLTGTKAPAFTCPIWLARATLPIQKLIWRIQKKDPQYTEESLRALNDFLQIDDSKARDQLGHNPLSAETAIRDCFDFLKQQGKLTSHV